MNPSDLQNISVLKLRAKIYKAKLARRHYLTTAPMAEKLRILEEMRDLTRALKKSREENKARVRALAQARLE